MNAPHFDPDAYSDDVIRLTGHLVRKHDVTFLDALAAVRAFHAQHGYLPSLTPRRAAA